MYYVSGMTSEGVGNMDIKERDWNYSRLVDQKKKEREAAKEGVGK
jgi:hypothetical protein